MLSFMKVTILLSGEIETLLSGEIETLLSGEIEAGIKSLCE
jgi:hypothetical protein